MAFMSRHRKAAAPRSWWQVIIPVFTLGALLCTGIVALIYSSHAPVAVPEPVAVSSAPQVTTAPPGKPVPHPGVPVYYYRVRSGDSWWSIAERYCHSGTANVALATRNHLPPLQALPAGRVIIIQC
jgi:hypothetical protein